MMVIFWDKHNIRLSEYLPRETTINGSYYAPVIERLHSVVLEKRPGKAMLLLHVNASVHKCNIVQTAIRKDGFVELNHPAYSPDIAPSDYYLFSNLKECFRGKNSSHDDETSDTVKDYLNNLDSESFCKGTQSLRDRWQRMWLPREGQYIE